MKTTLYIVHGWAYSIEKWSRCIEILEKQDVKVVMLYVPGLTEPSNEVWSIKGYVRWLDAQLKNVQSPIVLGHSNGGRIALNYAVANPDALKHLILLDSAGVANSSKIVAFKLKVLRVLSKILKPFKYIPGFSRIVHKLIGASDYDKAPENMKKTLQNMIDSDSDLRLHNVTVPTSIIWGERDTQTPLRDAHMLRSSLPNSRELHIIKDARHAPYDTHPQQLADTICDVLKHEGLK